MIIPHPPSRWMPLRCWRRSNDLQVVMAWHGWDIYSDGSGFSHTCIHRPQVESTDIWFLSFVVDVCLSRLRRYLSSVCCLSICLSGRINERKKRERKAERREVRKTKDTKKKRLLGRMRLHSVIRRRTSSLVSVCESPSFLSNVISSSFSPPNNHFLSTFSPLYYPTCPLTGARLSLTRQLIVPLSMIPPKVTPGLGVAMMSSLSPIREMVRLLFPLIYGRY